MFQSFESLLSVEGTKNALKKMTFVYTLCRKFCPLASLVSRWSYQTPVKDRTRLSLKTFTGAMKARYPTIFLPNDPNSNNWISRRDSLNYWSVRKEGLLDLACSVQTAVFNLRMRSPTRKSIEVGYKMQVTYKLTKDKAQITKYVWDTQPLWTHN